MKAAPKGRNLAGIVPIAGKKDQFDFPWPDYLQPLREGFLAVERSIKECAMAGCDSIWIVVNDDTAPIVRKRIGDYVMDPRYFEEKNFVKPKKPRRPSFLKRYAFISAGAVLFNISFQFYPFFWKKRKG